MKCERVQFENGATGFVCGSDRRPKCVKCRKPARLLCDWKVRTTRSGTCDKPVCESCSVKPAPGKDLCPDHAVAYEKWVAERLDREAPR